MIRENYSNISTNWAKYVILLAVFLFHNHVINLKVQLQP